ncbi:ThiJ/PfpI domain-containing protein [Gigaspora margarita]|uniref:ThiJ/PfpI domain-containing protein n=1 Tax=Gigaspora margarita TaxID=4874 RepID=A0A8H4AMI0_GIGMA|nr:ThiJ/PfpI domain-containing protein [Gigaspora margarita]
MADKCFVIGALLYPDYDLLDFNGTIRFLGSLESEQNLNVKIITISETGKKCNSASQCSNWADYSFDDCPEFDVLLIPGGKSYRKEIENSALIKFIDKWIPKVKYVLMVCSASAFVAKTGHLDCKKATSNKSEFDRIVEYGPNVNWIKHGRWIVDGKFYSSGGVSAGMDMALAWISDVFGEKTAFKAAHRAEYVWNNNPALDPFSGMNFKENVGVLDFHSSK